MSVLKSDLNHKLLFKGNLASTFSSEFQYKRIHVFVPLSPLMLIPRSVVDNEGAGKPGSPRSPLGPVKPGGP